MGRLKLKKTDGGINFYHIGKIKSRGPAGPKSKWRSMKNSMYAVVFH